MNTPREHRAAEEAARAAEYRDEQRMAEIRRIAREEIARYMKEQGA